MKKCLTINYINPLTFVGFILTVILAALLFSTTARAEDLLASGDKIIRDTIGQSSKLMAWIYLAEIVVGAAMYLKTKNPLLLFGFVFLIIMTKIGFSVVGG